MSRERTEHGAGQRVIVVGNDPVGGTVAKELPGVVSFLGLEERIVRRVADDVRNTGVLAEVGEFSPPERIDTAVIATAHDSTNLLAAQRLRLASDADILVRLNDPLHRQAFADLDVETVCATTDLGETLVDKYTTLVK